MAASDWLRGFPFGAGEKKEIISRLAHEVGITKAAAERSIQRYTTTAGAQQYKPSATRGKALETIVSEVVKMRLPGNVGDLGYTTKRLDGDTLRYRSRADAEAKALQIITAPDVFHNGRVTSVDIEYLPPGTEVRVWNPHQKRHEKHRVGAGGDWLVNTEGYDTADVPVETG